jgi:hypothetical protein
MSRRRAAEISNSPDAVVGDGTWLTTGGAGSVMVQQGDLGHTRAHSLEWGRAKLPESRRRSVA